ncbi:BC1872 family protein [Heyndrickxia camelliae]|uniref:Phage ABA sandwich domain-containing protein n=1 Tax=Heyndrickxia camelliae TaxID=1707093 RepID=A0A2N3LE51_9BACI|nr:hypothetical protein [Heyndrickxia camelliae]PKR82888.1 hypothetical protein CWO92_22115 [Heyndrickxia camelliae]
MSRQIDKLIIKHLKFDLHSETERGFWVYLNDDQDATLFRPSENIKDAWLVVEKFDEVDITKEFQGTYECRIFAFANNGSPVECWARYGDTPAMAICKAALYALGVEYDE